jgi:hypothetical protein
MAVIEEPESNPYNSRDNFDRGLPDQQGDKDRTDVLSEENFTQFT